MDRHAELYGFQFGLSGGSWKSLADAGSPHSKAGRALLPPDPPQILMNRGIGPQQFNGVKLPGQRCFGEHGMKLAMAGGTKFGLRSMVATAGSWHQVVYRVPGGMAETQLALFCCRLGGPGTPGTFPGSFPGSFSSHPDWLRVLILSIRVQKAPARQVHPPLILLQQHGDYQPGHHAPLRHCAGLFGDAKG